MRRPSPSRCRSTAGIPPRPRARASAPRSRQPRQHCCAGLGWTMTNEATRCGVVAVLGAPNAGKSTLVNRFVGAKVTIVSPKVQTTRTRVRGIALVDRTQIVYVDTPGIFEPKRRLERAMVDAAWGGASDADEIVVLVDAERGAGRDTGRSEEHTSELQSLMRSSYAVFCLKKKKHQQYTSL